MDKEIISALELLKGTGVSIIDAARFVRNILDSKTSEFKLTNSQYCAKVVQVGLRNIRTKEMSFIKGFEIYYKSKSYLRPDSLRDIRTIARRLIRSKPSLAERNFSEFTVSECEEWLGIAFTTNPQFNKARAMLHTFFQFAFRKEWCDKNPIKRIERKRVIEKEIKPLTLAEVKRLLKTASIVKNCSAIVALMTLAGIRPREAIRLEWNDIDLCENSIKVRSLCSKTGGVRHVEICPNLKNILSNSNKTSSRICPKNWKVKWRRIRHNAGFKNRWVQDVLRHTYASFYAKYYHDLSRLQLNMGHRDQSLLRSRYINMHGISSSNAKAFFR